MVSTSPAHLQPRPAPSHAPAPLTAAQYLRNVFGFGNHPARIGRPWVGPDREGETRLTEEIAGFQARVEKAGVLPAPTVGVKPIGSFAEDFPDQHQADDEPQSE